MLQRSPPSEQKPQIQQTLVAIYQGSFDPPHYGHQEVVEYCLKQLNCDKVYVLGNDPNKYKPLRSDYPARKAMLDLVFKSNPKVEIVDTASPQFLNEALNFFRLFWLFRALKNMLGASSQSNLKQHPDLLTKLLKQLMDNMSHSACAQSNQLSPLRKAGLFGQEASQNVMQPMVTSTLISDDHHMSIA